MGGCIIPTQRKGEGNVNIEQIRMLSTISGLTRATTER